MDVIERILLERDSEQSAWNEEGLHRYHIRILTYELSMVSVPRTLVLETMTLNPNCVLQCGRNHSVTDVSV